uniref:SPK1 n=1 Tax=Arundo donax TaxID=35708 RepID=A0A0A9F1D5_ARUDO
MLKFHFNVVSILVIISFLLELIGSGFLGSSRCFFVGCPFAISLPFDSAREGCY